MFVQDLGLGVFDARLAGEEDDDASDSDSSSSSEDNNSSSDDDDDEDITSATTTATTTPSILDLRNSAPSPKKGKGKKPGIEVLGETAQKEGATAMEK